MACRMTASSGGFNVARWRLEATVVTTDSGR